MNKTNIEDFYPLSPMQQGMLFHSLLSPESGVYVEQFSCILRGELDVDAFVRAWERVIDRYPILRTAFLTEGVKEPVQIVHRQKQVPVEQQDWCGLPAGEQQSRMDAFLEADRAKGFDLTKAPLLRLALIRIAHDATWFSWTYHHILLDGWSVPIVIQEVFAFYESFCKGRDLPILIPSPFRSYILWLKRQDFGKAEAFWRSALGGFTSPTPLVVDRSVGSATEEKETYDEMEIWLPEASTAALQALGRQQRLTLSTLVQAAWGLLLSRYSGEQDVVFGATVSGRPPDLPGSETMVGLFINTLPVRVHVDADRPAGEWLKDLQTFFVEMRQYEYSQLVQIQGWSEVPRGLPLFNSILVYENYPISASTTQGQPGSLAIEEVHSIEQTNYPLTVVAGAADQLMLKIVYDCQRFDAESIRRMLGHLQTLLEGFAANPGRRLADIPMLTEAEQRQVLVEWNNTDVDFHDHRCAQVIFEAQVEKTPDAPAVVFQGETLTYRELNRRANMLAHYLQKMGVGPETIVAILVERSFEMIIGILGVLKAGGAYLPMDPVYPPDRLALILSDARPTVLLTQEQFLGQVMLQDGIRPSVPEILPLDAGWAAIAREPEHNPASRVSGHSLAYVIYTSGSTGTPKGTLLEQRGLVNLVKSFTQEFRIGPGSRVLQFFSFGFDGSVSEIFPTLLSGATLCLPNRATLVSMENLQQFIQEYLVTHLFMTPSTLAMLSEKELPTVQFILSAGEVCPRELAARWQPGRSFHNAYGPTEASVAASSFTVDLLPESGTNIPIGRPIPNGRLYILDHDLRPVPIGVPGELFIGGTGVGRGYLNRPELTAERFIPDPFIHRSLSPVESEMEVEVREDRPRMYRTGDLVRYMADGNVEFLGRLDNQVKIRGFRIELGEIEATLKQHPEVMDAAVLVREHVPGEKRLVAYVVRWSEVQSTKIDRQEPDSGDQPPPAPGGNGLKDYLRQRLPGYMVPVAFVFLDALPLTASGKLDRRALPAVSGERQDAGREYIAPRDAIEIWLTRIWEEVLDVRPIGIEDNFFELGGHSMLAVRLAGRIQQRFGTHLPLFNLFQSPTVEMLAEILRSQDGTEPLSSLVPIQPSGSRQPLYFIHPSGGSVHWYIELAFALGSDQPFYGIQARGVNGDQELHDNIVDMAAHYVKAIRSFQPEGPYFLGSWSMGVVVAYEMACQLTHQGQEVGLLALLDQGPVVPVNEPEDDAEYLLNVFGKELPLELEELRRMSPDQQIEYVWDIGKKENFILPDVTLFQFRHFIRIIRTHTQSWRHYTPSSYPGRITLFRASEQVGESPKEPDMGWGQLAAGGVEIVEIPGDHLTMMHQPHVQVLAEKLRACLDPASIAKIDDYKEPVRRETL